MIPRRILENLPLAFLLAILSLAIGIAMPPVPEAEAQAQNQVLSGTLLPSAARTAASVVSADQTNCCYRGVNVIVNVSAWTSGIYTPTIQGKDPVSGTYYSILPGPTLSSAGITILKVYPGIGALANGAAPDTLPKTWRLSVAGTATPSMTFSAGLELLP